MDINRTKNVIRALGLDPEACLSSLEFQRSAEFDQLDSKYFDAIAIEDWPKAIELLEEHALKHFWPVGGYSTSGIR
jgi:hypothetical protein